jgi:hypothetical protein
VLHIRALQETGRTGSHWPGGGTGRGDGRAAVDLVHRPPRPGGRGEALRGAWRLAGSAIAAWLQQWMAAGVDAGTRGAPESWDPVGADRRRIRASGPHSVPGGDSGHFSEV